MLFCVRVGCKPQRLFFSRCDSYKVVVVVFAGTAVGKLLTLGGVGIWWIVDIVLLVTGVLRPVDGSNWEPYY